MANTIAGVNLAEIARDSDTLAHLTSCFGPLAALTTDFSMDGSGRESVATRIPTKDAAQDLSSGYAADDKVLTAKTVTIGTFYGDVYAFTDKERSLSAARLNDLFISPALDTTGSKVFGDVWNLVVSANFATSTTVTAANFDRETMVDAGVILTDTKKAPKMNRSCFLNSSYYGALVKTLNSAEFPGITAEKAEAMVPRVAKFDVYETDSGNADANSENVAGFAFHQNSLLIAGNRVDSEMAAQAGVEIEDVEIPGLGLPVQFRRWYDPTAGKLYYSFGVLYGVAAGTDMGTTFLTA